MQKVPDRRACGGLAPVDHRASRDRRLTWPVTGSTLVLCSTDGALALLRAVPDAVALESLGGTLRRARKSAGLTLTDLATEVGVSAATLSRAETGRGKLTADRLRRCVAVLGLELSDLEHSAAGEEVASVLDGGGPAGLFDPTRPGGWREFPPLRLPPALDAAQRCFLALGYHGTTVRDIADLAGLSVPGLYHHHPSKQSLLVALMSMLMEDFHARCEASLRDGDTPEERFDLLIDCFTLFHTYRRDWAFIGASEMRSLDDADRRRIAGIRNACQSLVDDAVTRLAASGRIRVTDPSDISRAVVTMLVGIASWYRSDGPMTPEQISVRYLAYSRTLVGLPDHG